MQQAVVDAIRTPMGRAKPGAALADVHPAELLAQVLTALVERNQLEPGTVDDVITGCVSQVGEQSATPGRIAWLAAGLPEHVPSTTIDRKCGSSQQAVHFAAQGIMAGAYDIVIACGVESMSRVPMGSGRIGQDPYGALVQQRYAPGLVSQGIASELVSARWKFSREVLDTYAARLRLKARARFVAFDVCGDDPLAMLTAPIPSSRRALEKAGLRIDDIAHFEINEAFAPVPLAWQRELKADEARLNPRGGAIALGHPLGASGAQLMTTMLHVLEDNGGRYGLQPICEASGMANATIIERL